jgi:predicted permease
MFHLNEDTEDKARDGLTREDARRAALLQFGNPARVQEDVRAAWSWILLDQLRQDLSYAVRGLWRSPGFTAGALAVLAVGIGANLTLLQIFEAATVYRYSIPAAESYIRLSRTSRDDPGGLSRTFPSAAVEFYRANSSTFAVVISEDTSFTVSADGIPERRAAFVSDNYFTTVAVLPSLGRVFDQQDARLDAPAVALLDHQYWRAQFGSDPKILGHIIKVNDAAVQVVGVLPDNFHGFTLQGTQLWFPLNTRRLLIRGTPTGQAHLFGKLKPGAAAGPGVAELTALSRELARQQPRFFAEDDRIQADLVQESLLHFLLTRSPAIVIFVGMVLLILLSASAHLGNMLLVRGLARQHEFGIRIAIGASRVRLMRQLVTENVLLAVLGSLAGLAVGVNVARLLLISGDSGPVFQASMHWQTLVACVAMTFISVFCFGLPSARETTRVGFQTSSLRARFVANQVSVSCVLLVVTGVFAARGILNASLDLTFDYRSIVVVDPQLYSKEGSPEATQHRLDALSARIGGLPGVQSVAVATAVPLRGRVVDNFPRYPRVQRSAVAPSFFEVMGLSVVHGRIFQPGEQDAVVASESAARLLWPNRDPLGQLWSVAGAKHRVVGIVQDSWAYDLNPGVVEAYLPIQNRDVERSVVILHTRGDPAAVVGMIPRAAAELDQSVSVTTMSAIHDAVFQVRNPALRIFGSLGLIATVLAAAGMFALVAFSVVQRRREIGIRIAIGATRRDLLLRLLGLHTKPLAGGMVKGAIVAIMLLLFIRAVVSPEPYVELLGGLALGLIFFSAVAVLSAIIPALRALRIDPSEGLRTE